MSNSLQPHGLQHARDPCPSLSPGVCSNTHVHWVSDTIQPAHPLPPPSPPAFNLSQHQGLFQWVSSWIRWPKYWSLSFSISPSSEYLGLISFRMDSRVFSSTTVWKHQFLSSAFSVVHLSHSYTTTGKTTALTTQTFVGKVTCLLFNMLSRFVIAFLPRSKRVLISWL